METVPRKPLGVKDMSYETNEDLRRSRRWKTEEGQKFVSDDDIIGRSSRSRMEDRENTRSIENDAEPRFISDEDIVRRRVA